MAPAPAQPDETTPLDPGDPKYQVIVTASTKFTDEESDAVPESLSKPPVEVLTSVGSIIAVLLLGEFISNADGTLVMAATARISSEFNSLQGAAWLSTGYTLGVCVAQPMYGKLSDIYGRKPLLLWSYFFLALGCVVCGVATDMWVVILGRALSGVGGAGVMTMSAIIITDIVAKREIATWRAVVNLSMTLGRSIGGPAGGVLTDTIGWRWAFLLQAPLLAIAALLVAMQLKLIHHTYRDSPSHVYESRFRRIDFRGSILVATSISTLILLLDQGGKAFAWVSLPTLLLFGSGVSTFSLFIYTELYVAPEPIFNLEILKRPNVAASYLVSAFQVAAQVSMMFTVPLYFQVSNRASSTAAGAHMIPAVAGNAIGGLTAGSYIRRTGNYKPILVAAGFIACISYLLQILRWNGDTGVWESLYIIFGGLGSGSAAAAAFVSMTAFLDPSEMAMATGGFSLLLNFALTAGITSNYTLLSSEFRRQLQRRLQGEGAREIIHHALSSIDYIASLTGALRETVVGAYVAGLKHAYIFSFTCSLLSSVTALTARNHRL
ncbi:major facilitator superfamily domain-containing protein [Aspergillus egyptiacus]|nr:major facilitator superfamily domain-containing protein [Aspergillus egyptiacus]